MAFLFVVRRAGRNDFRAQPSLKPEETEVRLVPATTSNFHTRSPAWAHDSG